MSHYDIIVANPVGLKQCAHLPVFAQGVFLPSLTQFAGDAIVSRRSTAEWRSVTILFKPATMITCFVSEYHSGYTVAGAVYVV